MMINALYNDDCLRVISGFSNKSVNIYYTDVPYNMGSLYYIDGQGHICFQGKGSDFMNKWEAMDGRWWDTYFEEVARTLKYGGFWISHNIDRQSWFWAYYAVKHGLVPMQKLYWLFIDNFPKGVDITKQIDTLLKQDRIIVGTRKGAQKKSTGKYGDWGQKANEDGTFNLTIPTSDIARKYYGYMYGIACLKQTVEEILVFWKPPLESVPKDIINKETNKRTDIHPSILNISNTAVLSHNDRKTRWTPQLLIHDKVVPQMLSDVGGVANSKDLARFMDTFPTIKYLEEDMLPYIYEPKASRDEADEGLEDFPLITVGDGRDNSIDNPFQRGETLKRNPHPSPKPKRLVKWVLKLFKPPEQILVVDTFMGSGVIPQCCKEEGIDYIGIEQDELFFKVCKAKLREAI